MKNFDNDGKIIRSPNGKIDQIIKVNRITFTNLENITDEYAAEKINKFEIINKNATPLLLVKS